MIATIAPDSLLLEITNVSNGWSYLNLHYATNQIYANWGTKNLLMAWLEDLTGVTNFAAIKFSTTTNMDGNLNKPVGLQAAPLPVTFPVQANAPGTFQSAADDCNGDSLADFTAYNLNSVLGTRSRYSASKTAVAAA